jgi:hypothetical protein
MKVLRWLRHLTAKREEAAAIPPGSERNDQPETAAKINRWLTSPGLRPPT